MGNKTKQLQEKIIDFLKRLEWSHEVMADNVIKTNYDGYLGQVKIMMHSHPKGLLLAIDPVLPKPEVGWGKSVDSLILTLAQETHLIKVGLDKEGDIYLRVDLPQEEIEFEQFSFILFNLCQVSEQMQVPVMQANVYDKLNSSP